MTSGVSSASIDVEHRALGVALSRIPGYAAAFTTRVVTGSVNFKKVAELAPSTSPVTVSKAEECPRY